MSLTIDRALQIRLVVWNAENQRAAREYEAHPIATRHLGSSTADRHDRKCRNKCGRTTRAETGVCYACRKKQR